MNELTTGLATCKLAAVGFPNPPPYAEYGALEIVRKCKNVSSGSEFRVRFLRIASFRQISA